MPPPEVRGKLGRGGVAILGFLNDRLGQHRRQGLWQPGLELPRVTGWILGHPPDRLVKRGIHVVRCVAGEQDIGRRPKAVYIASCRHGAFFAAGLLRSHEGRAADGCSGDGERLHDVSAEQRGNTQVHEHGPAVAIDQDVARLEIPVDDPELVEGLNGIGDARQQLHPGGAVELVDIAMLEKRVAIDVFGGEVHPAIVYALVEQPRNRRVAKLLEDIQLTPRSLRLGCLTQSLVEQLDSYRLVRAGPDRAVDLTTTATAETPVDHIALDRREPALRGCFQGSFGGINCRQGAAGSGEIHSLDPGAFLRLLLRHLRTCGRGASPKRSRATLRTQYGGEYRLCRGTK